MAEQGLEARSSNMKESFILCPLCPAAHLVINNNRLLLFLPRLPGCPPLLLLWSRVPSFRSLLWVRRQRRGIVFRGDLGFPGRRKEHVKGSYLGGSSLSRVTRIWGDLLIHLPWCSGGGHLICSWGLWLQLPGTQFLCSLLPPPPQQP